MTPGAVHRGDPVHLSVVIPTFQRRELILFSLEALTHQEGDRFEVVVVVDGSTDGTARALRERSWPFPLSIVEQTNRGQSVARNRGVEASSGDVVLFLDDDMEVRPGTIAAHLGGHAQGADAVMGAMLLHPASPRTILAEEVGRWGTELAARCSSVGYRLGTDDIFTGHLSIGRTLFSELGGFDTRFTSGGTFGNEDVDLSHRLVDGGYRVVYRPDAIAYQRFVVTAAEHLRRWEEVGAADVALARLHADLDPSVRAATLDAGPRYLIARAALAAPRSTGVALSPVRRSVCWLVDRGAHDPFTTRAFWRLHEAMYWRGVARARREV
jgi:glycosyltransferase involved in cell wall biosynthesis